MNRRLSTAEGLLDEALRLNPNARHLTSSANHSDHGIILTIVNFGRLRKMKLSEPRLPHSGEITIHFPGDRF